MHDIILFGEDFAHQEVIGALLGRLAREHRVPIKPVWRSARRGHGAVARELKDFFRDLRRQSGPAPVVVAADANCKGMQARLRELTPPEQRVETVWAIPEPHIERRLLLDGAAFRDVVGKGCDAPDLKCERDRYKDRLIDAIRAAGRRPILNGIEYARTIIEHMDLDRAARADASFYHFLEQARRAFDAWSAGRDTAKRTSHPASGR